MSDSLTITNVHTGNFPKWVLERPSDSYFGYFENDLGEQFVLVATKTLVSFGGGELDWEERHELRNPEWSEDPDTWLALSPGALGADMDSLKAVLKRDLEKLWPSVVLGADERGWLLHCLRSAAKRFRI